jgi:superfamily II DNA or RNA helicase
MPNAVVIGLTATPERGDGLGLGKIFQEQVTVATPGELIAEGFLVEPMCYAADRLNLSSVHMVAGDYNEGELAAIMGDKILLGRIVDNWLRLANGTRTVAFAVTVAHSQQIVESFVARGVAAEHLDGTTPKEEREGILERLRAGTTKVVSNCMVLTEGWDCPELGALILARATTSRALFMQMVGRVMRTHPGKERALVLDHADCIRKHGFPSDDYAWEMSDGDRAVVCSACGAAMRIGQTTCVCGNELPKRSPTAVTEREITEIVEVDGELRLVVRQSSVTPCPKCTSANTKKFRSPRIGNFTVGIKCKDCYETSFEPDTELATTATGADKRKEYRRLLAFALSKGFKQGWASHQYRKVFGCWPAGFVNSVKQELNGGTLAD